jgi:hypothetical protein
MFTPYSFQIIESPNGAHAGRGWLIGRFAFKTRLLAFHDAARAVNYNRALLSIHKGWHPSVQYRAWSERLPLIARPVRLNEAAS